MSEKRKILLVDDDRLFLRILSTDINSWGYQVVTLENPKEAVNLVEQEKPDIVILDYVMPDMNGLAVLKELRKIHKALPVIILTAHPEEDALFKESRELEAAAFVNKLSEYTDVRKSLNVALKMIEKTLKK